MERVLGKLASEKALTTVCSLKISCTTYSVDFNCN